MQMKKDAVQVRDVDTGRHSLKLLLCGACVGLILGGLAAAGKLGGDQLPDSIVAEVNGIPLPADEYQRALSLFGSEKRGPVGDRDRALVLERMIEEELLLQHGVASGVMRWHNKVREEALKSILAGLVIELESSGSESGNKQAESESADSAEAGLASPQPAHDALLAEYLGRLRATSVIRWMGVEAG
jgi:hypothetical protein